MRGFLAALISVAVLAAAPARAESLADTLIAAYRNSSLLEQNQAVLRAADEDAAVALATLRPVVEYTLQAAYARQESRITLSEVPLVTATPYFDGTSGSLQLSASIILFDNGRRRMGIEVARESVLKTRQNLISVEQQVLLAAVRAHIEVNLQSEVVALREANVRLITQELRAARDRFEVGEVTRTDVSQAEARLAAAQSGLAAAQGALMVARENYKAATGAYPRGLAALPRPPALPKSLDAAKSVAERTHPSVKAAQHELKIAELRVAIAETAFKPTIGARATMTENFNGLDNQSLGITMSQQLYTGGENSALFRKAIAGKDAARAGLHYTVEQVALSVGTVWSNLAVADASIAASDKQVRAAQTAFDGVREEATLGARTTLEVLNAEQELLTARAARLEAAANRQLAAYQILSSMGILTVEHLKLGIPTYDPESYYNAVKNAPATSSRGKALDRIMEKIAD